MKEVFEAGLRNHHLATTAYPIAHGKTIWGYRLGAENHGQLIKESLLGSEGFSLYAHIPFCERRCRFCEYCVVEHHDEEVEAVYHAALMTELERYLELLDGRAPPLVGFDIGGGTPSLIQPSRIQELVARVLSVFSPAPGFHISIETTPRIAARHPERMSAYMNLGIERISMGLQMTNPRLLKIYGRDSNQVGHNARAVRNIRKAGFRRLNIDLMYGLARQSEENLAASLGHAIELEPEYITIYRMRYKGTRISSEASQVELERVVAMYELCRETLLEAGYLAEPGKNTFSKVAGDSGASAYLTSRVVQSTPYLGIGLGAQSFTNNLLAYNSGAATKRMTSYLKAVGRGELPIQDLYHLPLQEGAAKMTSVSFYFGAVDRAAFRRRFGEALVEHFAEEVAFLVGRGLVKVTPDALVMTRSGARSFNGVLALFYSDRVKDHLVNLDAPVRGNAEQ